MNEQPENSLKQMLSVIGYLSCHFISQRRYHILVIPERCGSSNGYSNGFRNGTNGFATSSNGVTRSTNRVTSIIPSSPATEIKCEIEMPTLPFRIEALKLSVSAYCE
jgi:hypothetical protein